MENCLLRIACADIEFRVAFQLLTGNFTSPMDTACISFGKVDIIALGNHNAARLFFPAQSRYGYHCPCAAGHRPAFYRNRNTVPPATDFQRPRRCKPARTPHIRRRVCSSHLNNRYSRLSMTSDYKFQGFRNPPNRISNNFIIRPLFSKQNGFDKNGHEFSSLFQNLVRPPKPPPHILR